MTDHDATNWDPGHPYGRSRERFLMELALDAAVEEGGPDAMVTDLALVMRRHGAQDAGAIERLIFEGDDFNRAMGQFEDGDEDGYAADLGAALVAAYLAACARSGGPSGRVGGIAVPGRLEDPEDAYYAGQLLATWASRGSGLLTAGNPSLSSSPPAPAPHWSAAPARASGPNSAPAPGAGGAGGCGAGSVAVPPLGPCHNPRFDASGGLRCVKSPEVARFPPSATSATWGFAGCGREFLATRVDSTRGRIGNASNRPKWQVFECPAGWRGPRTPCRAPSANSAPP